MSAAAGLDGLESRRLQLEENIAKLRKSLQHWRTWDAEYEGLKEEIAISDELQSAADCVSLYKILYLHPLTCIEPNQRCSRWRTCEPKGLNIL